MVRLRAEGSPNIRQGHGQDDTKAAERGKGSVRISLDLGLSTTVVRVHGNSILLPNGAVLDLRSLEPILEDEEDVYALEGSELKKVALSAGGLFYKLVCAGHKRPQRSR